MSAATILKELYETGQATTLSGERVPLGGNLSTTSTNKLSQLVRECKAENTLEVGFAYGASALAILTALEEAGRGHHVACDPKQTEVFSGGGLKTVQRAGASEMLEFYEEPSHAVLPRLVSEGRQFDLIFIDGYHSFDYAFIDYFYADLLLRDGGLMVFDDWGMPQVYHVVEFLRTHKAYQILGPHDITNPLGFAYRVRQKRRKLPFGVDAEWGTICAFKKLRSTQVPWGFFDSTYYPGYWLYRRWMKLRKIKPVDPLDDDRLLHH